jgi:hypothetical protein
MSPFGMPAVVCRRERPPVEGTGSSRVGAQSRRARTHEFNRIAKDRKDGSPGKTPCSTYIPRVESAVCRTAYETWWSSSWQSQTPLIIKNPCRQLPDVHMRQIAAVSSGLQQSTGVEAVTWPTHYPQEAPMNPIINQQWTPEDRARYGIRSIDDFTNEELARLQEKLVGWMSQRATHPKNSRHRAPFVMKRRTDATA